MRLLPFLALLANVYYALTATPNEWRSRSIYQVVTDRFGRSDGSTTASCDPGLGKYCGGSWNGLVDKLDYIKGMGFSAVCIFLRTRLMTSELMCEGLDLSHHIPGTRSNYRSCLLPWLLAARLIQAQ